MLKKLMKRLRAVTVAGLSWGELKTWLIDGEGPAPKRMRLTPVDG